LTTLYLAGAKKLIVGMPGRGIYSVLFLCTFRWSILCKPTVATSDIYLFGIELTPDEAIHFKDLELITDHFDNLSLLSRGTMPTP
jgi:hypothetical protein